MGPTLDLTRVESGVGGRAYHIAYSVMRPSHVRLEITDGGGRSVRMLVNGLADAGSHELVWDGDSEEADPVAAGKYACRLVAQTSGGQTFMQARSLVIRG